MSETESDLEPDDASDTGRLASPGIDAADCASADEGAPLTTQATATTVTTLRNRTIKAPSASA